MSFSLKSSLTTTMSQQGLYEFTAPDADVVLVSHPDATEFRVHRCILAAASPLFRDMFTLPQPPSSPRSTDNLPVIPVTENRTILDNLLRFVYPTPDPPISTLDELSSLIGAAVKYDFNAVVTTLSTLLVSPTFVEPSPTRAYAIACRYELEEAAKQASRCTLIVDILDKGCPPEDLKNITALSYHRLLEFHRGRSRAAQDLLKVNNDLKKCVQCNGSGLGVFLPPKWWKEFAHCAKEELRIRPTTDVIFQMEFLARAAFAAGCLRCFECLLESHKFLTDMKDKIDELPATISGLSSSVSFVSFDCLQGC
jgi:hypothetical protein